MDKIWRPVWTESRQFDKSRRELMQKRDADFTALLTPEQKAKREQILQDYDAKLKEVARQRDADMTALLSPEQKATRDQSDQDEHVQRPSSPSRETRPFRRPWKAPERFSRRNRPASLRNR